MPPVLSIPPVLSGFLFVDKPINLSSAQVVAIIKKQLKAYQIKVGHGGTLDPLATGILPIALGEATKIIDYSIKASKEYSFTIQFGKHTTTYDLEGEVTSQNNYMPSQQDIINIIPKFLGPQLQVPPVYSAIKVNGLRSYALARQNISAPLPPRAVNIISLALTNYHEQSKTASFTARVSSGTYIRSLAVDISSALNSLGYVSILIRTDIGYLSAEIKEKLLINSILLYSIQSCLNNFLVPIENMLDDILAINITLEGKQFLQQGNVNNLPTNYNAGIYKAMHNNKLVGLIKFEDGWTIIRILHDYINSIT